MHAADHRTHEICTRQQRSTSYTQNTHHHMFGISMRAPDLNLEVCDFGILQGLLCCCDRIFLCEHLPLYCVSIQIQQGTWMDDPGLGTGRHRCDPGAGWCYWRQADAAQCQQASHRQVNSGRRETTQAKAGKVQPTLSVPCF